MATTTNARQQELLLHDLARAMIFSKTQSEKSANEKAADIMSPGAQDELISSIYKR